MTNYKCDACRPFTPPPPRERLSYTRYQLQLLNGIYSQVRYPNSIQKQLIAKRVGITREQVKVWFQNRRRKDVVGATKSKSDQEDDKKSDKTDDDNDSCGGDSSSVCGEPSENHKDSPGGDLVSSVVMKSIIAELTRYEKNPLKVKTKKKHKSDKVKANVLRVGLASMSANGYDMVSPPNQITPSAFEKNGSLNLFTHSKESSAFETPKIGNGSVMNPPESSVGILPSGNNRQSGLLYSLHTQATPSLLPGGQPSLYRPNVTHPDTPVLSNLPSYKLCLEAKCKDVIPAGPSYSHNYSLSRSFHYLSDSNRNISHFTNPNGNLALNNVFPFPFIADSPLLLSSLRHAEQPFHPSAHYLHLSRKDDPYQPLVISSLSNPYFVSPPPIPAWTNHNLSGPSHPNLSQQ
ncbi:hypothetical protein CHS0354_001499 [Potamilus streckersoni]|uniref:Homeobox domain-containing protein n=1 Tax=Potamilus streckersoni TaxID=2493646 RepID=A0AAE0VJX4_9BIVA|nr:hypothetical protein CHS0354_001499 [Potamilus streckersoni]